MAVFTSNVDGSSISGTAGADLFTGSGTSGDTFAGNGGNDRILGQNGQDFLLGNEGDDFLRGGGGSDTLFGGEDNDSLSGGAGFDVLSGDQGADTLRGGGSLDTFVFFARTADAVDTIVDFQNNETFALFNFDDGSATVDGVGNVFADIDGTTVQIATIANFNGQNVDFDYYSGSFNDSDLATF